MAEVKHVAVSRKGFKDGDKSYGILLDVFWETMTDDDTGEWVECGAFADKTVAFSGTIGAGTIIFQGSNDPTQTNVWTVNDHSGDPISITSLTVPIGLLVAENPRWIRPVTASGSSNYIDVRLIARLVM